MTLRYLWISLTVVLKTWTEKAHSKLICNYLEKQSHIWNDMLTRVNKESIENREMQS